MRCQVHAIICNLSHVLQDDKVSQHTLKELTVLVEIAQSHSGTPGLGIKKNVGFSSSPGMSLLSHAMQRDFIWLISSASSVFLKNISNTGNSP